MSSCPWQRCAGVLILLTVIEGALPPFGKTFGNGLAGVPICGSSKPPQVIVDHTLSAGETHGVLHHFWLTGARDKIDRVWVDYYVDGEANASISFQPSMMCGVGFPQQREYSAGGLCGKSAPVGGWWNTYPIPFYKSVVVKVRADPSDGAGCFWGYLNIRGTEGMPLVIPGSGVPLPTPGTRLVLQRNPLALRQPLEYVTLAQLPAGRRGMIFQTSWAVEAEPVGGPQAGGGYIEGCWQFYGTANEPFPGLVVGTGLEDYYDSGYYFGADSGQPLGTLFSTPLSGLTLFERIKGKAYAAKGTGVCRDHNGKWPSWGWGGGTKESAMNSCNAEPECSGYGPTASGQYQFYCKSSSAVGTCNSAGNGGSSVTSGSGQESSEPCMVVVPGEQGGIERLSAYRFHNSDPLVMTDGGKLNWRVGAKGEPGTTKCGNPIPPSSDLQESVVDFEGGVGQGAGLGRQLTAVKVTTYAWIYTFETAEEAAPMVV